MNHQRHFETTLDEPNPPRALMLPHVRDRIAELAVEQRRLLKDGRCGWGLEMKHQRSERKTLLYGA